jgi:hypothetical protein
VHTNKEKQINKIRCNSVPHEDSETYLHNIFKEGHPTYSLETEDAQLSEAHFIIQENAASA